MTNLPQIQSHNTLIQAVNARELHHFLQSRQDFSTWIKNQDFVVFHKSVETPTGGRPDIEYHISLDMAKQSALLD